MTHRIIVAHRGAPAYAPENTIQSFEKAWKLGADMIELDLRETDDGYLVCIHDSTVDRTTTGSGDVSSFTLKELKKLDAGAGQEIPLLEDVLKFARGKLQVNIDLKIAGAERRIIDTITRLNMNQDVLISSFLHILLPEVREIDESIKVAILIEHVVENLASYAKDLGAYAVNPAKELTNAELVQNVHHFGIRVFPWTVNNELLMKNLFDIGVDGIITDHPDIGVKLLRSEL